MKKLDDYAFSRQQDRIVRDMYRQEQQIPMMHKRKADNDLLDQTDKKHHVDQSSISSDVMRTEQVH